MDEPLERAYFDWLAGQVGSVNANPRSSHRDFLEQMFRKVFVWLVANDDNRVEDAIGLRYEFVDEIWQRQVPTVWFHVECSFLEMMVALSRRLAWQTEGEPSVAFWHLAQNLGVHPCTDANYRRSPNQVRARIDEIMDDVIWRQYKPNGRGGFFPLDHPHQDQRTVEIWYQMSAYLLERD